MIEQIGGFIGMMAADVVHFFRGRQAVPCPVEWVDQPQAANEWGESTIRSRPDVQAVFKRPVQEYIQNDPTGVWDGECTDCGDSCCLATDTIGEIRGQK